MLALFCAPFAIICVFCFCRFQRLDRIVRPSSAQQTLMLKWGLAAGACGTAVMTLILRQYVEIRGDFPPNWAMVLQCMPMLYMTARYAEMKTYHTAAAEQTQAEADYAEATADVR